MISSSTDEALDVWSPTITARRLGVHKTTLRRWNREGIGPKAVVLGPNRLGYQAAEVKRWLDEQTREIQVDYTAQERAALTVLAGSRRTSSTNDPEGMLAALRGSSREVLMRLAEATNIIAYLCRLSDRPEAMLAAPVESVTTE